MLVAHRGFRSKTGENRMIDFIEALKICKAVEFDIRMTKDKQIIIFHDHNLKRIAGINKTIRSLTYDELKNLDFFVKNPDWVPAHFIDDFAKKISKKYIMINVEIKPDRYTDLEYKSIKEALDILRKSTTAEIIVSSFSHSTLKWISQFGKDFKKGYLMEKPSEYDPNLIKGFDYLHPYVGSLKRSSEFYLNINLPMNIWTFKKNEDVTIIKSIYPKKLLNAFISDKKDLKI
ncbi:glycerophosphodiester phosphodiesterase [Mesoplasma syrphidae]|uniref:Glycerophosphodiester phosphodiesterase n=1 Tax=Mesoplasma syrphidae TaxID=225999 RepID=A0A2K9C8D8_9MOLU|nr:glycerophosphodiester phosphodiesterase family protein [Mesoplasma syrphidae]AUF83275.1 glycerophosphodiester phosphodiesterase [Mesoplasma syrphidae]